MGIGVLRVRVSVFGVQDLDDLFGFQGWGSGRTFFSGVWVMSLNPRPENPKPEPKPQHSKEYGDTTCSGSPTSSAT